MKDSCVVQALTWARHVFFTPYGKYVTPPPFSIWYELQNLDALQRGSGRQSLQEAHEPFIRKPQVAKNLRFPHAPPQPGKAHGVDPTGL